MIKLVLRDVVISFNHLGKLRNLNFSIFKISPWPSTEHSSKASITIYHVSLGGFGSFFRGVRTPS